MSLQAVELDPVNTMSLLEPPLHMLVLQQQQLPMLVVQPLHILVGKPHTLVLQPPQLLMLADLQQHLIQPHPM